ncbi:hypothetical protein [Acinetobacter variabilis]|uniref:hypothetical protein n=1 Tax=Acinetobacter variabilis TaxID=70346 RepID=UPI0028A6EA40|nr:hypothetical protein [Acinetobacter variabilis]
MTSLVYMPPLAEYDDYGQKFVAGQFSVGEQAYVIVFNDITSLSDMQGKGYNITVPGFTFPSAGMVEVLFDAVSDVTGSDFGSFGHVTPPSGVSPVTLLKVMSIIEQHYNVRRPGGYLFYAATNAQNSNRETDLTAVYDRLLGVAPMEKGRLSKASGRLPAGWQVISGLSTGGRGYAIIC